MNRCVCIPIKFYSEALKCEFHVIFMYQRYASDFFSAIFKMEKTFWACRLYENREEAGLGLQARVYRPLFYHHPDIENPSHLLGSGKKNCLLYNFNLTTPYGHSQTSCMRRSFHSSLKCFHFLSQQLKWCSRKSSKLLTAYACAAWVSQTPNLIITTRLQCSSCRPICLAI